MAATPAYSSLNLVSTAEDWCLTSSVDELCDGREGPQATGTSQTYGSLKVDLGSAKAARVVAILNSTILPEGTSDFSAFTVRVRAADNLAMDNGLVTTLATTSFGETDTGRRARNLAFAIPAIYTKRYWDVLISWTGGARILKAGEVWFGYVTPLSRGLALGLSESYRYQVNGQRNPGSYLWQSTLSGPIRDIEVGVDSPSEAEALELRALWRASRGGTQPLLWVPKFDYAAPAAHTDCAMVRAMGDFARRDVEPGRWEVDRIKLSGMPGELL